MMSLMADISAGADSGDQGLLGWCLVANVARETARGEAGLDIRRGTRHFAAGTKLWIPRPRWDPGHGRLQAVGHHRGSPRRFVSMVVRREDLENFRAKGIYNERLIRYLNGWSHDPAAPTTLHHAWESQEQVQEWADAWNNPLEEARIDGRPNRRVYVPNPPPPELHLDGETFHLAHFNAKRARYNAAPPPKEPEPRPPPRPRRSS